MSAIYPIIRYAKKKDNIRKLFAEYLQKQEIPEKSVKDTMIWFSPLRLLHDHPAWEIAVDFADTPGIRRFGSEDGVIIPEGIERI